MKKQNIPLAMEILGDLKRRNRFWRIAFVVTLAVVIISRVVTKIEITEDSE